MYVATRTAASMGDATTALYWLDRPAEVGLDNELDPDDFGAPRPGFALAEIPSSASRVRRLATPEDLYLGGIDGLAGSSPSVVAIHNLVGRTRSGPSRSTPCRVASRAPTC